jgi:serine/threonine-protein kinase
MNPTQLGPYEIKSRLGRGGMGAVYEAVDTTSGKTVAVKVLASHLADDAGLRKRFDAEIDALKNLRHPGIVRLLAFGEQDDQPFFAMELVRGKSLEHILRSGRRFSWRETVAVAIEITRALKVAHDHGIVHRDLKPANLLVTEALPAETPASQKPAEALLWTAEADVGAAATDDADKVTVKLADFGIAKLFGGAGHTALGHVVGTAEYMAPEQAAGRLLDHRADLYSLGLVMYAMLTGAPPFRGTQLTEVIDKQRRAIPPRVASLVPDMPTELDELIARLLSKDPAQRPASALALGRLLAAIEALHSPTDGPAPARPADKTNTGADGRSAAARGIGLGPTAHERSNKATQPDGAIGRGTVPGKAVPQTVPRPGAGHDLDLLAPTQPLPNPVAQPPRPRSMTAQASPPQPAKRSPPDAAGSTSVTQDLTEKNTGPRTAAPASPADPSRLPTDVASATTQVERGPRNRFTTVEDFERTSAERARREQRRQLVWQGLSAVAVAAALAVGGWLMMKPPSADTLYERITAVANDEHGDLRDARGEIDRFLDKHAADPRAGQIRELKRTLDLDMLERRARRRLRSDKELAPLERDYREAMTSQENGPSACVKALEAMLAVHATDGTNNAADDETNLWLDLARRQVEKLRPQALAEQRDDGKRSGELLAEAASLAARAEIANDEAARKKLLSQRRVILENIVEVYAERPHAAEAVAFAKRELAAVGPEPQTTSSSPPAAQPAAPVSGTGLSPAAE